LEISSTPFPVGTKDTELDTVTGAAAELESSVSTVGFTAALALLDLVFLVLDETEEADVVAADIVWERSREKGLSVS
jgi:hypothetical protein